MQLLAQSPTITNDKDVAVQFFKAGVITRPLSSMLFHKSKEQGLFLGFAAWNEKGDRPCCMHRWPDSPLMAQMQSAGPRAFNGLCDDEGVPLICPTCQVFAQSVLAGDRLLLCMGLFSIFLVGSHGAPEFGFVPLYLLRWNGKPISRPGNGRRWTPPRSPWPRVRKEPRARRARLPRVNDRYLAVSHRKLPSGVIRLPRFATS